MAWGTPLRLVATSGSTRSWSSHFSPPAQYELELLLADLALQVVIALAGQAHHAAHGVTLGVRQFGQTLGDGLAAVDAAKY